MVYREKHIFPRTKPKKTGFPRGQNRKTWFCRPNPGLGAQGAQVADGYAPESGIGAPRGPRGPFSPLSGAPLGAQGAPRAPLYGKLPINRLSGALCSFMDPRLTKTINCQSRVHMARLGIFVGQMESQAPLAF